MNKLLSIPAAIICLSFMPMHLQASPEKPAPAGRQFSRAEYMVMNLNRGDDSTGAHVSESLKEVRLMVKELDKGLRQLQQVDKEFAKSKGRPDDHFLGPATDRLQQALRSAQQLEQDLTASRDELKEAIQQALITP